MTIQLLLNRFFLLAALFSLTLSTGCGDDDSDSNPTTKPQPDPDPETPEQFAVTFAPLFPGTAHSQIGVFAFETGNSQWSDNATPNFMYHQLLENKDGAWTYDPIKYWPEKSSDKISFFAYAPYATGANGLSVSEATHQGVPVLEYAIPSGNDCHTDLCIALPAQNKTQSEFPVEMEFVSVMAKIGFRIKGQGEKISKIEIRGIQNQGQIILSPDNQGVISWTLSQEISMIDYASKLKFDESQDYVTATETMTDVTAEDGFIYLIPQNITYNARIVVTIDGVKFGFPFESVSQFHMGREHIIDLIIPGNKLLDYTDNAMPAFLLAPADAAEASNISWADAKTACGAAGYRLPTYNEGLMTLFYMNGVEKNNFRFASYWTSTTSLEDMTGDNAMGYNILPWMGLYMPKIGITAARCVKDAPAGGKKYPYVDTSNADGPIIVSRDSDGGVNPSAFNTAFGSELYVFHDNWATTPDHDCGTDADKISRKLQVANSNATNNKVVWSGFSCPEGWRKPTMMEMALIFTMGGAPQSSYGEDNAPVSSTPLYGVSGFTPLNAAPYWVASMTASRGGSRYPSTWSFTATPRSGGGTTTGPDANYVRCVRDIE